MTKKANSAPAKSRLHEVCIRSLGVIEQASIEFAPGLTVLTGETGAGKTMILTALGLISGAKSDSGMIRKGAERLSVSATFSVPDSLHGAFIDAGAEMENGEVIFTRSVTSEGRSKVSAGGATVTASKVSELTEPLLQVHGQSTNYRLAKPAVQRKLLDEFLPDASVLADYQNVFSDYSELRARITRLKRESAERENQIAELNLFLKAFNEITPVAGELDAIDNDISRLGSVEEINESLSVLLSMVDNEESSVSSVLLQAQRAGERIRGKDSALDSILDRFGDAIYALNESVSEILRYASALDADPQSFENLQQRKASINALIKKFGVGTDKTQAFSELIERAESSSQRLADLTGGDSLIATLEKTLSERFADLQTAAKKLSKSRQEIASDLSQRVTEELHQLAMPSASITFTIEQSDPSSVDSYTIHGIDEVQILFVPHKGSDPSPLSKIASGGELSRVMLGIEVVVADQSSVGTYIFDEIDSGVGGKAAFEIGRRLKKLSKRSQVVVVTHLPQVAAWGDRHLMVRKDESGAITASDVHALTQDERVIEVARLLSGQESSESAQEHALELLKLSAEE